MNKLEGLPKCLVVNLSESTERKKYIESEFERLNITDFKILSYDRYDGSNGEYPVVVDHENLDNFKLAFIGTVTSHLLTIKWWYENTDEDTCIIFEDDCDFSTIEHWNFTFKDYIKKFGTLWDCIQLCLIHEGYGVMYPRCRNYYDHGLQSYIIKRHYAKKIIDYYFRDNILIIKMPLDIRENNSVKIPPSIENVIYGLGNTYIHPLFNHNVELFSTTVHIGNDTYQMTTVQNSYMSIKTWWENVGSQSTLDQIFDYDYCCPSTQQYYGLIPIDFR